MMLIVLIVLEAELVFRRNSQQPKTVRRVVPEEVREEMSGRLSHVGYSVFSWPLDDPMDDEDDEEI